VSTGVQTGLDRPGPNPAAPPVPDGPDGPGAAADAALEAVFHQCGLVVLAEARWPESAGDAEPPAVAGFIVSSFNPVAAEVARRCMERAAALGPAGAAAGERTGSVSGSPPAAPSALISEPSDVSDPTRRGAEANPVTGIVVTSALGDLATAQHVAEAVDAGHRVGPLLFFQCVPNAVAGHIAAQWGLTGPVVCLGGPAAAADAAAVIIEDGDAERVLLLRVDQARSAEGRDEAHAFLVAAAAPPAPAAPNQYTEPR
jgi:hypothetical protein